MRAEEALPEPRIATRDAGQPALTLRQAGLTAAAYGIALGVADAAQQLVVGDASAVIRAARKVSANVLWLSPLLAGLMLVGLGVVLLPLARGLASRWKSGPSARSWFHAFNAGTIVGLAAAVLGILHGMSVALLALGAMVWVLRGDERWLRAVERRAPRVVGVAVVGMLLLAAAVPGAWWLQEWWRANRLVASSGGQNVILLVLDTVRRDRFFRDNATSLAPNLESLARRSLWYENAWAVSSWSLPSQASILTGLMPEAHGAVWPALELRSEVRTLAQRFADAGYATGGFSGNDAWGTPEYLGRGFVHYSGQSLLADGFRTVAGRSAEAVLRRFGLSAAARGHRAATLLDRSLAFIDRHAGDPVFLYICLMDVNRARYEVTTRAPLWRRVPPDRDAIVAAYDSALSAVDRQVGEFLDSLRARRLLERTLVIVTSDHGESFGAGYAADHDPDGHASTLYPEQVRVPLIVSAPGVVPGIRTEHVSLTQIAPSVAHLAGLSSSVPSIPLPGIAPAGRPAPTHVMLMLRYSGMVLRGEVRDPWLYLTDSSVTPPRRDSVRLVASVPRAAVP